MIADVQVLQGREVPLGGLRAITVRRTLPHRDRAFIGAWCFVDHYGPQDVASDGSGGMDVPPHPHTGLQTVSWLFEGEIEHRDTGGVNALVRPGEVNLMTAGHGIAHSEITTDATRILHGVQLWVVLPHGSSDMQRTFDHFAPDAVALAQNAGFARVFLGEMSGVASSPVVTQTPLLGAQLELEVGAALTVDLDPAFEHGVLLDSGELTVNETPLHPGDLGCLDAGAATLELQAGEAGVRLMLLGGEPFEEDIIMWWNFIGRTHEDIEKFREQWESGSDRFGAVQGYDGPTSRIPAPPLPGVRLKTRNRHGRRG